MRDDARVQTVCLLILTAIAIGVALFYLRPVLLPFVLALFFSLALRPLIDIQVRRFKFPSGLALISSLGVAVLVLALVGVLVAASIEQVQENGAVYQAKLNELIETLDDKLPLEDWFAGDPEAKLTAMVQDRGLNILRHGADALLGVASDGILVLIFMIFLVAGRSPTTTPADGMWHDIEEPVKSYLSAKFVISAFTGVLVGTILAILGVDLALVFGVFAFLLNFIPNIGSMIATLLPVPIVLLSDLPTAAAIAAIAIPGTIQFLVGNVIEPKMLGSAVDLHPVTVLLSLIFWGLIWGFVGMVLSVPLTTTIKIVLERTQITQPVAALLAGHKIEKRD
ncbi:MAG: AI-2E family transporter [Planctomycetota bacterium]